MTADGGDYVLVSERPAEYVQRLPHLARISGGLLPSDQQTTLCFYSRLSVKWLLSDV